MSTQQGKLTMIAVRQKFEGQTISLDGGTFQECEFENCILLYSATLPVILEGSSFKECRWQFVGPAGNTVSFITFLYQQGEKDLVEAILENVRKEGPRGYTDHSSHSH
jgi:hypothetical protein